MIGVLLLQNRECDIRDTLNSQLFPFKPTAMTVALNAKGTGMANISDSDAIIEYLNTLVGSSNLNAEPIAVQVRAAALFARLKALNRAANGETRAHKQATSDARTEMDHTHLGLQNLLYEKRHLEREIEKCKQFG